MATPEHNMWERLRAGLYSVVSPKNLRLQRVETGCAVGVPDVAYSVKWKRRKAGGWIELKRVKEYPKRSSTVIRLTKFTKEQKLFIRLHGRITKNAFLLVQVERDWYLFDHIHIDKIGETATRSDWELYAVNFWIGGCNFEQLFKEMVR